MKVLRRAQFVVGVVVGAVAAGGIAYAAIPNKSTGQITACYGTDKILKVVDTVCPKGTTKLTWQSKGVRYMGAWSSFVSYQPNDVVTSGGASYVAKKANKAKAVNNTTYWAVLAAKGATGAQGEPGASGPRYGRTIVATQTVDSTGDVGRYSSLAIGLDGNPVMSYSNDTNGDLKVAACTDPVCATTPTITTLDDTGIVGAFTSITIGSDGNPVISYFDDTNTALKVAACNNPRCTDATISTIDTEDTAGLYPSITVGTNGYPIISYRAIRTDSLRVAACNNLKCTDPATITNVGTDGLHSSIAIGVDGNPVISYRVTSTDELKVAACTDSTCTSSPVVTTIQSGGGHGYGGTSIAIGVDGNPVISYGSFAAENLYVTACTNSTCTTFTTTTIDSVGNVGRFSSLVIGLDGNPLVSYYDLTNDDLKLATCTNPKCTSSTVAVVDAEGNTGLFTSMSIGTNGSPVISYYDFGANDLKIAVIARSSWTKNGWGR